MPNIGKFITFEGTDGSGKTTQINSMLTFLDKQGIKYITTREPGGTVVGEKLREILLHRVEENLEISTELLLMIASRVEHIKNVIKPALDKGTWVICDRFTDATIAYQGYGAGFDVEKIYKILKLIGCDLTPDLTLFIDIDVKKGLERIKGVKDRFEKKGIEFLERVRKGYIALSEKYPARIKRIDGSGSVEQVFERILSFVGT